MQITSYPDVDALLRSLLRHMRKVLGGKLVGLYLYGSLTSGDFNPDVSDIDLLAIVSSAVDDGEFEKLGKMHAGFVAKNPDWEGRLEIAYLSTTALKIFRSHASKIAITSPGEPFHFKEAGKDYLMNWWTVREKGIALFGPSPTAFIDPISKKEFLQSVKEHARWWKEWIHHLEKRRPAQAYAILTLCRALYACENDEQASKQQAALWTQERFPQWASLIQNALAWRNAWRDTQAEDEATFSPTTNFVRFAIDQIVPEDPKAPAPSDSAAGS